MQNAIVKLVIIILISIVSTQCLSDENAEEGESDNWFKWLKNHGLEIRKSFSGTAKDQTSPAQLSYFNQESNEEFFNLDVAIKITEYSHGGDGWDFRLYPVLEKHKSNNELAEVDKESVAANTEIDFALNNSTYLLTNLNYKFDRDKQNDKTTRSTAFYTSIIWTGDFAFGRNTLIGDHLQLYYLPSIGYEKYLNQPIEQKIDDIQTVIAEAVDEEFGAARFLLELKPLWKKFDSRLVVNLGYTKRWLLGESDVIDENTDLIEVVITYYLDAEQKIGVGFNYTNGESPTRNFLDEENSSIGLNFKF